jgi:hypothetical protein|tara:strand:+ start:1921 stop:2397 length:477 start_codon:yes stop_codon:yes gene_type:complete
MGRSVKTFDIAQGTQSISIPTRSSNDVAAIQSTVDGQFLFNSTTNKLQVYIGSQFYNISTSAADKTIIIDKFQGDGTTTVFGAGAGNTLDQSTAATLSVVPTDATDMVIFVGGIYQTPATNYTYSGGQITFGSAPPANDGATNGHIITVIHNLHKLGE